MLYMYCVAAVAQVPLCSVAQKACYIGGQSDIHMVFAEQEYMNMTPPLIIKHKDKQIIIKIL